MCVVGALTALFGLPWMLEKEGGRNLVVNLLGRPTIPFYATDPLIGVFDGLDQQRPKLPVVLVKVADGFRGPTDLQFLPGSAAVLVVAGKGGRCEWVDLKAQTRGLLFDLPVATGGELGLLGLAFHPDFVTNGRLYVHYNVGIAGHWFTRVARWHVERSANAALLTATETEVVLELKQPYDNHNGGQIAFGPDGYLYIGLGDGGDGGDPHGNGQNRNTLLSTILRIDVDHTGSGDNYAIPSDNPFVGDSAARAEVWAYGVRNPWRFSFDPSGRIIVADVGQDRWEELSFANRGDNLGWRQREADTCFAAPADGSPCDSALMREPFLAYGRDDGQSITGGFVYQGSDNAALRDKYVFADFVRGRFWAIDLPQSTDARVTPDSVISLGRFTVMPSAFARDIAGELYVADFGHGSVYRIARAND